MIPIDPIEAGFLKRSVAADGDARCYVPGGLDRFARWTVILAPGR